MSTVEQEIITGYTYQLMRGTEDALKLENRVLQDGEPVVVNRNDGSVSLKVGDGTHAFLDLPYVSFDADALANEVTQQALSAASAYLTEQTQNYVTVAMLTAMLSGYVTAGALDSYVKTVDLNSQLADYAKVDELDDYCTVSEFNAGILDVKGSIPTVAPISAQRLAEVLV